MIGWRNGPPKIALFSIAFWVSGAAIILLGLLLTDSVSLLAGAVAVVVASALYFYVRKREMRRVPKADELRAISEGDEG